ncbi:DsbA family protein [Paenibacillus sp. J2TS4]|uniref:DsbA family protein n=1 Tax=Paenibacillus sp. J2TS4 TaxID=2807194 RepID=UPI001B101D90|nr:DsbA family protein [Paenibacillus sp. J2TS4]GIP31855.1 DsbA family protein [Paenibacillus sp. J2TS4]
MRKFIYIFDALCPWCYAFTPIVKKLHESFRPEYGLEVLSGGLVVGDRVGPMDNKLKENIRTAYSSIVERSGAVFGEPFYQLVESEDWVMNSEIPAVALAVFRESNSPSSPLEFVHRLYHFIYVEGKNPNTSELYEDLACHFKLDPALFVKRMEEDHYIQQARYDFALAKQLQAEAFPRLFLQTSETYFHLIAKGYSDYEQIVRIVDKINNSQP